jgi:hypothetical protein
MKKSEITKLMAIISEVYSGFEVSELKVGIFMEFLKDLSYKVVEKAIFIHISQSKYAPTIAEIRKHAVEIMNTQSVNANTAWGEVKSAIRNFGMPRTNEAILSLSPLTAKVVNAIGFTEICKSENQSVIRGQFIKLYNELRQEETDNLVTPINYRELSAETNCGNLIEGVVGGCYE